jgi:hypothetical protein
MYIGETSSRSGENRFRALFLSTPIYQKLDATPYGRVLGHYSKWPWNGLYGSRVVWFWMMYVVFYRLKFLLILLLLVRMSACLCLFEITLNQPYESFHVPWYRLDTGGTTPAPPPARPWAVQQFLGFNMSITRAYARLQLYQSPLLPLYYT